MKSLTESRPASAKRCVLIGTALLCLASICSPGPLRAAEPKRDNQMLVEPAQLQKRLNDPDLRILDVRSPEQYRQGHIPGALRVDVGDWKDLAFADGGLRDRKKWAAKIGSLGITSKSQVVVYGGRLTDAARIWWLLKYVGVKEASLLNGNWDLWAGADLPTETTTPQVKTTSFQPKFQTDRLAEIESLKKSLKSDGVRVVDTRSDREFASGRIPGSTQLEWTELLAEDGRFKTKARLKTLFREKGIQPSEAAVCY